MLDITNTIQSLLAKTVVCCWVQDASVISAIVNSAIRDESPYVTGDDFSIVIPGRDEEAYISRTVKVRKRRLEGITNRNTKRDITSLLFFVLFLFLLFLRQNNRCQ